MKKKGRNGRRNTGRSGNMAEPRMEFTARVGSILRGLLPCCWVAESGSRSLGGFISMSTSGSYNGTISYGATILPVLKIALPPIVRCTRIRFVDQFPLYRVAHFTSLLIFYNLLCLLFTINYNLCYRLSYIRYLLFIVWFNLKEFIKIKRFNLPIIIQRIKLIDCAKFRRYYYCCINFFFSVHKYFMWGTQSDRIQIKLITTGIDTGE